MLTYKTVPMPEGLSELAQKECEHLKFIPTWDDCWIVLSNDNLNDATVFLEEKYLRLWLEENAADNYKLAQADARRERERMGLDINPEN